MVCFGTADAVEPCPPLRFTVVPYCTVPYCISIFYDVCSPGLKVSMRTACLDAIRPSALLRAWCNGDILSRTAQNLSWVEETCQIPTPFSSHRHLVPCSMFISAENCQEQPFLDSSIHALNTIHRLPVARLAALGLFGWHWLVSLGRLQPSSPRSVWSHKF